MRSSRGHPTNHGTAVPLVQLSKGNGDGTGLKEALLQEGDREGPVLDANTHELRGISADVAEFYPLLFISFRYEWVIEREKATDRLDPLLELSMCRYPRPMTVCHQAFR
jgi:hypothetical protein